MELERDELSICMDQQAVFVCQDDLARAQRSISSGCLVNVRLTCQVLCLYCIRFQDVHAG